MIVVNENQNTLLQLSAEVMQRKPEDNSLLTSLKTAGASEPVSSLFEDPESKLSLTLPVTESAKKSPEYAPNDSSNSLQQVGSNERSSIDSHKERQFTGSVSIPVLRTSGRQIHPEIFLHRRYILQLLHQHRLYHCQSPLRLQKTQNYRFLQFYSDQQQRQRQRIQAELRTRAKSPHFFRLPSSGHPNEIPKITEKLICKKNCFVKN